MIARGKALRDNFNGDPLFWGTAVAITLVAFAVGYRATTSLPTVAVMTVQPSATHASRGRVPSADKSIPPKREGLQVSGFAKIGSAEMMDLLTAASPQERERWAEELSALSDGSLKVIAFVAFYTAWLNLDPAQAIHSLRAFPDPWNRLNVLDDLVQAASPTVLPQLLDVISEATRVERIRLLPEAIAALAATDPGAAASFIDSHPNLVDPSDVAKLISTWAGENVEGARKWLEASSFSQDPDVLFSLVDAWSAKDLPAARDYVLLHRESDGIERAASSVVSRLFDSSPEQARNFIVSFNDEHAKGILAVMLSSAKDEHLSEIADWAAALPSELNDWTVTSTLSRWASVDSTQALNWLRKQPGAKRESILVGIAGYAAFPLSADLVSMTYGINDEEKRDQVLIRLVDLPANETQSGPEQIRALKLPAAQTKHLLELRAEYEKAIQASDDR